MKRFFGPWFLAFVLAAGGASAGLAESDGPPQNRDVQALQASGSAGVAELAAEVSEISHSAMISHAKKEKRISTAVRVAVVAATAYKQNPEEILGIGLELAVAATQAAPSFTEAIANAVVFAPAIARIDGAASRIRTAASAAARTPRAKPGKRAPAAEYAGSVSPPRESMEAPAIQVASQPAANESPAPRTPPTVAEDVSDDSLPPFRSAHGTKPSLDSNSNFSLIADLGIRYDDNIFWNKTAKVSDTIVSVSPGAEYQFGQNSLGHGLVRYQEAFTHYLDNTVPNAYLGNGSANFGYSDDKLTLAGTSSFNQLNQNNPDILGQGRQTLLRSNIFAAGASAEVQLTSLLSAKAGSDYNRTDYQTSGLISNQNLGFPLNIYFQATPKLDISTGFTYNEARPDGGGPTGKDLYYNVGLRGSLTPKLTTEFTVGEETQNVANNPRQHVLSFDGTANFQATPITNCVLGVSRGFSMSALGQSLVNGSYRLGITNTFAPQWQVGTNIAFRTIQYGPAIFVSRMTPVLVQRNDSFWEGSLELTYDCSEWLKVSGTYTLRNNQSTDPAVEFSNNVLGMVIDLRY
jgi:hypothetical protein